MILINKTTKFDKLFNLSNIKINPVYNENDINLLLNIIYSLFKYNDFEMFETQNKGQKKSEKDNFKLFVNDDINKLNEKNFRLKYYKLTENESSHKLDFRGYSFYLYKRVSVIYIYTPCASYLLKQV